MRSVFKIVFLALLVSLAGCKAAKKVPYVETAEVIPTAVLAQLSTVNDPILAPGDLLNIDVSASDMMAVAPFNRGMYVDDNGKLSKISSTTSTQGSMEVSTEYYLINQDGSIVFPGLGSVHAAGLTKQQLAEKIADEIYPKYIKERPNVDVRLMNFRVVVTGAVNSPGIYKTSTERMNFFEAIALAGDLNIKGDRENILLFRTNADGSREVHKLNIHDRDFLLSPYFNLQQNDIIYVTPNSSMASTAWAMNPGVSATLTYIGGISSLASLVIGIVNLTK